MQKDYYSYISVISFDDDGISIEFPDLDGCYSCADNNEEITKMASEALALWLWSMERDGEEIPKPRGLDGIKLEQNQMPLMVEVFMPPIREKQSNRFVKKTLSLPAWLNAEAEAKGVNFSGLLQSSLKEHLGIITNY